MMEAFCIESPDGKRMIVVQNRFGGYSFHLDEAQDLIDALLEALSRAIDPEPLPEAEPNPHHFAPRPKPEQIALESLA